MLHIAPHALANLSASEAVLPRMISEANPAMKLSPAPVASTAEIGYAGVWKANSLFLKKHPLITAAIGIVYVMVCLKSIKAESNFQGFLLRTLMTGAAMFFLYQVSGDKTLTASYNDTWYVIKVGIGFLIMAMPIGALGFLNNAGSKCDVYECFFVPLPRRSKVL